MKREIFSQGQYWMCEVIEQCGDYLLYYGPDDRQHVAHKSCGTWVGMTHREMFNALTNKRQGGDRENS